MQISPFLRLWRSGLKHTVGLDEIAFGHIVLPQQIVSSVHKQIGICIVVPQRVRFIGRKDIEYGVQRLGILRGGIVAPCLPVQRFQTFVEREILLLSQFLETAQGIVEACGLHIEMTFLVQVTRGEGRVEPLKGIYVWHPAHYRQFLVLHLVEEILALEVCRDASVGSQGIGTCADKE